MQTRRSLAFCIAIHNILRRFVSICCWSRSGRFHECVADSSQPITEIIDTDNTKPLLLQLRTCRPTFYQS